MQVRVAGGRLHDGHATTFTHSSGHVDQVLIRSLDQVSAQHRAQKYFGRPKQRGGWVNEATVNARVMGNCCAKPSLDTKAVELREKTLTKTLVTRT